MSSPDFGLHIKTTKIKSINNRYIALLQMGWFTVDTKIRFRLGHNQIIASLLEDPNLVYILDNYEADLTKDKIQSTETTITVWFGEPIPKQATLEAIEKRFLNLMNFKDMTSIKLSYSLKE